MHESTDRERIAMFGILPPRRIVGCPLHSCPCGLSDSITW